MSLALADIDGDGDLDLYVANYRTTTLRDMPNTRLTVTETNGGMVVTAMNGRPATEGDLVGRFTVSRDHRIKENGEADVLFLNDGKGGFTSVSWLDGAFLDEDGRPLKAPPYDWGLSVAMRDLNGDGVPDIYVCNDFESPDRFWINDGKGHFRALPKLGLRQTSIFSMGVDVADLNRDGFDEIFTSDMLSRSHARRMLELGEIQPVILPVGMIEDRPQYSHNALFLNRGDGTYAEISQFAGVEASEWTWSPNFLDVDLDGYEDLLITTGHELQMMNGDIIEKGEQLKASQAMSNYELQKMRTLFPRYAIPNAAFRNRGDMTFEDVSAAWGFDFPDVGNSVAFADLDNDGDLDVVVNNLNGPAEIYRNETAAPRIGVRLRGLVPNTQGLGSRVIARGGPVPIQSQEITPSGRYLGGSDPMRTFAAGTPTNRLSIEVSWRDGRHTVVTNLPPNAVYELAEPGGPAEPKEPALAQPAASKPALFEDVSAVLGHFHHDEPFDDFSRQPLLPRKLSQLGPGVSWFDADGDGLEDLFVGSGRGGQLGYFHNAGQGAFQRVTTGVVGRPLARDQTSIVPLAGVVLAGSANYEDGQTNGGCLRVYDLKRGAGGENVHGQGFSTGPVVIGGGGSDGNLVVFVGGRALAGRYPEAAPSLLLGMEGGRLAIRQKLDKFGLVSGATFADLDGDGIQELIVACEWGPVRVLKHEAAGWTEVTERWGLKDLTGWWQGVAAGDLDGDGRMDLVVSNWGRNTRYKASKDRPESLHFGDVDESGTLDIVEGYIDIETGREVPRRGLRALREAIPQLQERFPTFEGFGKATVQDVLGVSAPKCQRLEAIELRSMVFLNRGGKFEAVPLPAEAQWAPAFSVCIADFDGDGAQDVFLSQNFFAVNRDEWRHDAGRGLLLRGRGDGTGNLVPVSGQESGVLVYGEQRGAACADYDGDGRLDLAVSQNGNATKLYHNRGARPGLRVQVHPDDPANPFGFGVAIRAKAGDRMGAIQEVQGGSGYWSMNGPSRVVTAAWPVTELWVRWPGGKEMVYKVPDGAREVVLSPGGQAQPKP